MKTLKHLIQIVAVFLMVVTPYQALAITPETSKAVNYDAPFYDAREKCDSRVSNLPVSLQGNDNIEKAFRYFTAKGFTPDQSAAIVGNLQQESGVNPESDQASGPGRGIAQWSEGERWDVLLNYAKTQGKSETDLGLQLDFIMFELQGTEKRAYEKFLQETTLSGMVISFARNYERAGQPENTKRIKYAQDVLRLYGNSAATPTVQAGSVYMIGDSITEGLAKADIAGTLELKGWTPTTINASQGRSITNPGQTGDNKKPGIDAIVDDQAKIKDAKVIYVGLGTNPGGTISQTAFASDIDRFVDKIKGYNSTAPIYWLNIISPAIPDKDARNQTLATRATSKGFTIIDGNQLQYTFDRQSIHPTDYRNLREFVTNTLSGARAQTQAEANQSCVDQTTGNGQDTKYIDGFTIYNQYDREWKDLPYGSSTIGTSGCGPSALAMVVTALTGQKVTPPEVATYAAEQDQYQAGKGSSWTISPVVAARYGLKSTQIQSNVAAISEALVNGGLVVAPGAGSKPYTSGGHFIVIRAVTADGKWRVGDSGHSDTSDKNWDPETLVMMMRDGGVYAIYK